MAQPVTAPTDHRVRVTLPTGPLREWSSDRLEELIVAAGRAETRITALRLRAVDELSRRRGRGVTGQRMADALAELLLAEPTSDKASTNGGGGRNSTLLLIADYDTVTRQVRNLRLGDDTPLPTEALAQLACDARVVPAFFNRTGQPLWLGRSRRVASSGQRIALVARDRGCVGCGADPSWCQAHHIIPWAEGGPTTLENMCLVCSQCHHLIHDQNWQLRRRHRNGKLSLQPP